MQEDTIIQNNLFSINSEEPNTQTSSNQIPEDLSNEELKKESQKRPRHRKNSTNFVNQFKKDLSNENNSCSQTLCKTKRRKQ